MNRHTSFLAMLILYFLICGTAQAIVQYSVTDLGTLGGTASRAYGINNSGKVVGWAWYSNDIPHAFLYSGSTISDLGVISGSGE